MDIYSELKQIYKEAKTLKEREKYTRHPEWKKKTFFFPIRHFNSDTPVIPSEWKNVPYIIAEKPLKINYGGGLSINPLLIGGGYFLWCKGKGVAIDPGHNFVYSLYRYHGIGINNIHVVIITHDHMDHHADLETILTLRRGCTDPLSVFTTPEVEKIYSLRNRSESSDCTKTGINGVTIIPEDGYEHNGIIPGVTLNILPAMHWQRVRKLFHKKEKDGKDKVRIEPKDHLKKHFNAFGVALSIESNPKGPKRILITGDSLFPVCSKNNEWHAYSDTHGAKLRSDIPHLDKVQQMGFTPACLKEEETRNELLRIINNRCKEMINVYENIGKVDIVCLHIGSIEKFNDRSDEKLYGKGCLMRDDKNNDYINGILHDPEFCYGGFHLGFLGALRIMEILMKKGSFDPDKGLMVLTEFGEELLGNRRSICETFSHAAKFVDHQGNPKDKSYSTLPSEVTLRIDLSPDDNEKIGAVLCSYCGNYHDWKNIMALEGPGELITFAHKKEVEKGSP